MYQEKTTVSPRRVKVPGYINISTPADLKKAALLLQLWQTGGALPGQAAPALPEQRPQTGQATGS